MLNPKLIFKANCAGRDFWITRYRIKAGHIYVVGESGVEIDIKHTTLEGAYHLLAQRMHVRYSMSIAESILLTEEQVCE